MNGAVQNLGTISFIVLIMSRTQKRKSEQYQPFLRCPPLFFWLLAAEREKREIKFSLNNGVENLITPSNVTTMYSFVWNFVFLSVRRHYCCRKALEQILVARWQQKVVFLFFSKGFNLKTDTWVCLLRNFIFLPSFIFYFKIFSSEDIVNGWVLSFTIPVSREETSLKLVQMQIQTHDLANIHFGENIPFFLKI